MDIFRAIFQDSDVEESVDDGEEEEDTPLPAAEEPEEEDVMDMIFEIERSARQLEKKEYPVKPPSPVVVGPVKPPPELLAMYAAGLEVKDGSREKEHSRKKKKRRAES